MAVVNLVGWLHLINDVRKKTYVATIKRLLQTQTLAIRQHERMQSAALPFARTKLYGSQHPLTQICIY